MATRVLNYIISGQDLLSPKMTGIAAKMQTVGKAMTKYITLPVIALGAAATHMAVDFNGSMQKINALVGVSQKQVDAWKGSLLDMARKTGHAPKELADALFFVTSAGFRGKAALDVLNMSARASAAGLGETRTVADAVTSALNAYAGTGLKAVAVTDTLVAAVREGKMPTDALAGAIGQVLPVASEVGVTFQEVAGTAAALSRSGADVHRTMMGMRFLLSSLVNPTSKAAGVLGEVGLSADDIRKSIRERGLLATLQMLKDKLPIQDFLKVVGGARGVVTALGLVGKNGKQVEQVMKNVAGATGSTDRAFASASKTSGFKFRQALASLQATAIKIGSKIAPPLATLAGWLGKVAEWFGKLPPGAQNTILAIAGIAAVIGPLILLAAKMVTAFKLLSGAVRAFGLASKIAALGNPWVLLAATIATVALLIITHWKTVQKWAKICWEAILGAAKAVWNWLKVNWPYLVGILGGPFGIAAAWIAKHWDTVKAAAGKVISWIKNTWSTMISAIRRAFAWVVDKILWGFGLILHGAAWAFGWIPGIGGKLRNAARQFDKFRRDVTNSIAGINGKTITVGVKMSNYRFDSKGYATFQAEGGHIRGPGGPKGDKIAAWLSDNEFVEPAEATNYYGVPFMEAIRRRKLPRFFAAGGLAVRTSRPTRGSIDAGMLGLVSQTVTAAMRQMLSYGGGTGGGIGGSGVARWASLVLRVLAMLGQSSRWLGTVLRRMNQESGGNPYAINRWDINAQRGDPSRGLMQTIGSTFAAYAGPFRRLGIYNPLANIYAGLHYALHRYGSLAALARPGGYALGGQVRTRRYDWGGPLYTGYTLAYNGTGRTEQVVRDSGQRPLVVNIYPGAILSSKQETARYVVEALEDYRRKGGKLPGNSR